MQAPRPEEVVPSLIQDNCMKILTNGSAVIRVKTSQGSTRLCLQAVWEWRTRSPEGMEIEVKIEVHSVRDLLRVTKIGETSVRLWIDPSQPCRELESLLEWLEEVAKAVHYKLNEFRTHEFEFDVIADEEI